MTYDIDEQVNSKIVTTQGMFATNFERQKNIASYRNAQRIIQLNSSAQDSDYKYTPQDPIFDVQKAMTLAKEQSFNKDFIIENINSEKSSADNVNPDGTVITSPKSALLSDQQQEILDQVSMMVAKKMIETYVNAYMATEHSDQKWRLGTITGTFMGGDEVIENPDGSITEPFRMYTRSMFSVITPQQFWDGSKKQPSTYNNYYTQLMFPPYKIGANRYISDTTNITSSSTADPPPTFDQDNFSISNDKTQDIVSITGEVESKPTGFTYRDPGFKAVNDNIMFLQHLLEKATGVVSTYLTEWDLSLYMQENLLQMDSTGGTAKLWLNYRVREDNPLSDVDSGYYNDRALCFNVMGSAVSKIDFDCQKIWRPSDFPLSAYWTPYIINTDFNVRHYQLYDELTEEYEMVPYPSWFDEPTTYSYKGDFLAALKHDDFLRMGLSGWKTNNMMYFMALYMSSTDGLSDLDITSNNKMQKVLGADFGQASKAGADLKALLRDAKNDCIDDGGMDGAPTSSSSYAGTTASKMAKKCRRYCDPKKGGGDAGGVETDEALEQLNQAISNVGAETDTEAQGYSAASVISDTIGRPDASSMGNYTGMNRFTPCLYGGPHGSDYSPMSVQGYFQVQNKFLRNVPRIAPDDANKFKSTLFSRLFIGNNSFYDNGNNQGFSPTKALKTLKDGILSKSIGYAKIRQSLRTLVKGTVEIDDSGNEIYKFPETYSGEAYTYTGDYIRKTRTEWQREKIIVNGVDINGLRPYWWWMNFYYWMNKDMFSELSFRNGEWGRNVVVVDVYRYATIDHWVQKTYYKYNLHDEPNIKWEIVGHRFLKYNVASDWDGVYWSFIRRVLDVANFRKKYPVVIRREEGFKLSFYGNDKAEKRVRQNMVEMASRGYTPRQNLIFLEGNESQRFTTGPQSIFQAEVREEQYLTLMAVQREVIGRSGWRITRRLVYGYEYVYKPYLMVDMNHAMPFYQDGLNLPAITNMMEGSIDDPLQLWSPKESDLKGVEDDILKKFNNIYLDMFWANKIIGEVYTKKEPFLTTFIDAYNSSGAQIAGTRYLLDPSKREAGDPEDCDPFASNFYQYIDKLTSPWRVSAGGYTKIANGKNRFYALERGTSQANSEGSLTESQAMKALPRMVENERYNLYGDQESKEEQYRFEYLCRSTIPSLDANGNPTSLTMQQIYSRRQDDYESTTVFPFRYPESAIESQAKNGLRNTSNARYYPYILNKQGSYPKRYVNQQDLSGLGQQYAKKTLSIAILDPNSIPEEYHTGDLIGTLGIDWMSGGTVGISGIGILSQLMGFDSSVNDSPYENYSSYMTIPTNIRYNTPFITMPFTTKSIQTLNSEVHTTADGQEFYVDGGMPVYAANNMDIGLKNAWVNMGTRATFYKFNEAENPYIIGIDTPFRTLLAATLEQQSYFKQLSDLVLNLDFSLFPKLLDNFVDKSVSKACGISQGALVRQDSNHPLYNHWLQKFIELTYDKSQQETLRQNVKNAIAQKQNLYNYAIKILTPLSQKNINTWTWTETNQAFDTAIQLSNASQIGIAETFLFGYLNLLYEYRKFFICKRFNKQDGTMWVMRALESVLNYVAPSGSQDNPPPSPQALTSDLPSYKVAFFELQNKTSTKKKAFISDTELTEDRISVVYVKVNWVKKSTYKKWLAYQEDPINNKEVPEVVKIRHDGKVKYAIKPKDGTYNLLSKEFLDNEKNLKYNSTHPTFKPKPALEHFSEGKTFESTLDVAQWFITWGDEPDLTPISWNIFVNLDQEAAMGYGPGAVPQAIPQINYTAQSISPEEFICLVEEGADFWKVSIPEAIWPRSKNYKTKLKLKYHDSSTNVTSASSDPYVSIIGSSSYKLYPIVEGQSSPTLI